MVMKLMEQGTPLFKWMLGEAMVGFDFLHG